MIWNHEVFIIHVLHVCTILVAALYWSEHVVDVSKAGCGIVRARVPLPLLDDALHPRSSTYFN